MNNRIEIYRNNDGLNNTLLKAYILSGIYGYTKKLEEEKNYSNIKEALTIGSACDTLLTNKEEFNNLFYIATQDFNINDKSYKIINESIDTLNHMDLSKVSFDGILESTIIPIARENNYRGNIKDNEKYKQHLKNDCEQYFNFKLKAGNRAVLSIQDYQSVHKCINKFNNLNIFNNNNPDLEITFQQPLYSIYNNTKVKILLDVMIINKKLKKIFLIDIKTLQDRVITFKNSFKMFLYNVQAVFYTEVVKTLYPDYIVHPLEFIAASYNDNLPVQKFTLTEELYNKTLYGDTTKEYKYMGILQAMDNINTHIKLNEFELDLDMLYFKNSSKTQINSNFLYDSKVSK